MISEHFKPTPEQELIIGHWGSAFITACPGAGKTRVMVERARMILQSHDGRGIAFLSFTREAVFELVSRLQREAILGSPTFPHFIGTFDSFIWQFIIAPFGIPNSETSVRLIPDRNSLLVRPFEKAQPLPLSCFDRATGKINATAARRYKLDITKKKPAIIKAFETSAQNMRTRFLERGELDFDDARDVALARVGDKDFSKSLSTALAGRFREIIVDEAQDCNPADLEIIRWLRNSGIPTKIVCDPNQSIYEFRGGVTDHLSDFSATFDQEERMAMSGNFRSSANICKAITMLRSAKSRHIADEPLGKFKDEQTDVYLLSYSGKAASGVIGKKFSELLGEMKIAFTSAPILAATKSTGFSAIGQAMARVKRDLTMRLAEAVRGFYFAFEQRNQKSAIEEIHKILLELEGRLSGKTYHQCIYTYDLDPNEWRPQVLHILRALRYDPQFFVSVDAWLNRARELFAPYTPAGGLPISQRLKRNKDIAGVLMAEPAQHPPAKTIHSVKGLEFPAVCVVTVASTLKGILDYLETGEPADKAEMARELYVAASRAQRLLVIAAPKSQSARFAAHLGKAGASLKVLEI